MPLFFSKKQSLCPQAEVIVNATPIGIGLVLENHNIEWCNEKLSAILELPVHIKASQINISSFFQTKEFFIDIIAKLEKQMTLHGSAQLITQLITYNKKIIDVLLGASRIKRNTSEGDTSFVFSVQDITNYKENERKYQSLFKSLFNGFALHEIICDKNQRPIDYRFLEANQSFEIITGLSSKRVIGKTFREVFPDGDNYWIETYGKVALEGTPITIENYSKEIGKYVEVVAYQISKGKFATIFSDITEKKKSELEREHLQKQLFVKEKMASIGDISASVAHEINNPLAILKGFLDLTIKQIERNEIDQNKIVKNFHTMKDAIKRISLITNSLKNYAKADDTHQEAFSIQQVITESLGLISMIYKKEGIDIETIYEGDNAYVFGSKGKFHQVLMNLFTNAKDAILAKNNTGQIIIKVVFSSDQVSIAFSDNGIGIEQQDIDKIFDKYYTTKIHEGGTGLGLDITKAIINEMKGVIEVSSIPDKGTVFTIGLPIYNDASIMHETTDSSIRNLLLGKLKGRVLIVEDDAKMAEIIFELVKELGPEAIVAHSGHEAINLFKVREFDFLITDHYLGDMNADTLIKTLQEGHLIPSTKIFIISGGIVKESTKKLADEFISKPFSVDSLYLAFSRHYK